MQNIKSELEQLLIERRENQNFHNPLRGEDIFYEAIKEGNVEFVRKEGLHTYDIGMGKLSEDPVRNMRYHFVVGIGLATRICIRGGMDSEQAYTLSDIYIQHMDRLENEEDIRILQKEAFCDFALRMNRLRKQMILSKHIVQARDYIEHHLTDALSVKEIAAEVGLHPDYLSRIFRRNVGMTLTDYVKSRRVEISKHMLQESRASGTQIAAFLGFSSCSHYIEAFKKFCGMTPQEYRRQLLN